RARGTRFAGRGAPRDRFRVARTTREAPRGAPPRLRTAPPRGRAGGRASRLLRESGGDRWCDPTKHGHRERAVDETAVEREHDGQAGERHRARRVVDEEGHDERAEERDRDGTLA